MPNLILTNGETNLPHCPLQSCDCCPYGYHIDLDFIRHCESLAKVKTSNGEKRRRNNRLSRKSLEVMLGLEDLCKTLCWDDFNFQSIPEVQYDTEVDSKISLIPDVNIIKNSSSPFAEFVHFENQLLSSPSSVAAADRFTSSMFEKSSRSTVDKEDAELLSPNKIVSNMPDEIAEFLHDTLGEAVKDFEKTLERTKNGSKRNSSWEHYIHAIDSYFSTNKSSSTVVKHKQNEHHHNFESEEIDGVNGTSTSDDKENGNALKKIREQMAVSLRRMKDLEEEVKRIPKLQIKLKILEEENRELQNLLEREKDQPSTIETINLDSVEYSSNTVVNQNCLINQNVNKISLDSLVPPSPILSAKEMIPTRDFGVMCCQPKRDVGISVRSNIVRTVGTNTGGIHGIHDEFYTRQELERLVEESKRNFEEKLKQTNKQIKNLISVGTQMVPQQQFKELKNSSSQTIPDKKVETFSMGIMVQPSKNDATTLFKPETKTIGCSENTIFDRLCEKCSLMKKTVACGPDELMPIERNLNLKQFDMPSRSLSYTEIKHGNLGRKSVGVQYRSSFENKSIQTAVPMANIGIQNSALTLSKSCQYTLKTEMKATDTDGLISLIDKNINTDKEEKKILKNCGNNTEKVRTKESGTNPMLLLSNWKKDNSSNTENIIKKNVACGDLIKPHISISCADNYCDSCKEEIKALAKKFARCLNLEITGAQSSLISPTEGSRIPRSIVTNGSPKRIYMRQNTYVVESSKQQSEECRSQEITNYTTKSSDKENFPSNVGLESSSKDTNKLLSKLKSDYPSSRKVDSSEKKNHSINNNSSSSSNSSSGSSSSSKIKSRWTSEKTSRKLPEITEMTSEEPLRRESVSTCPLGEILSDSETNFNADSKEENCNFNEINDSEEKRSYEGKNLENYDNNLAVEGCSSMLSKETLQQSSTILQQRTKAHPSKEMKAALKVINDSLQKTNSKSTNLKNAASIVQKEWFQISSVEKANPLDVEDYLDCFEEYSINLIKYMVNLIDSNGNTAMHYAVSHGNFDIVSILLDSKVCDVNLTNNAGYTSVMLVSLAKLDSSTHRTVVQRLFQMADVNLRAKKHGQTALMLAVSHGNFDMVKMLLTAGADINIQDDDGSTALMCAAEHGRIDIVKYLLSQSDCDSLIQDVDGSTAFKIAWQAGFRDIGLLLYIHEQILRSKMPNKTEEQQS